MFSNMKWKGCLPVLLLSWFLSLTVSQESNCHCSLFKRNANWVPEKLVFTMGINRHINCTDLNQASRICKSWCEGEMVAMRALVSKDISLLQNHQPNPLLDCGDLSPVETAAFVRVCRGQTYLPASEFIGPAVCCDPITQKSVWCLRENDGSDNDWLGNQLYSRRLNLQKDQNDASINEIEDIGRPQKTVNELIGAPSKQESSISWVKAAMKFFGYKSFGDLIRNIDIFSLPSKVKKAVRTYKDELSMGRCYMEFTTFKIFTKEENPFQDLLRKKRDASQMEFTSQSEIELNPTQKEARKRAVTNFMGTIANFMDKSEETRQYAGLINTFLPVVSQMYNGDSSSVVPTLLNMVGPVLKQMQFKRPSRPSENVENLNSAPSYSQSKPVASNGGGSSPLTSMAVGMIGNLIRNYLSSPPSAVNKVSELPAVSAEPQRPAPPTIGDFGSQGIGSIINLLLQGFMKSPPRPRPRPQTTLPPVVKKPVTENSGLKEKKSFIDMLLEVIRPVFISIMGETPGESGVKDIRRVSSLSTLGRVDDTLREEVDSPFFCFKKYVVNKAWSVTESGLRTVVDTFDQEEKERMMRMLRS